MRFSSIGVCLTAAFLSFGCGHEAAGQRKPAGPASFPASNDAGTQDVFDSAHHAFQWRLPSDWEFVPLSKLGIKAIHPGIEMVAARMSGRENSSLAVVQVREVVAVVPGQEPSTEALDAVEASTGDWIRSEGQESRTSRVRVFGVDAVRVDGKLVEADAPTMHVTSVTFYRNRRRFELQCISSDEQPEMPCGAGFRELIIRDQLETPQPGDQPRVLHLREERYRLRFDAPDDTWLAIGPRTGGSGSRASRATTSKSARKAATKTSSSNAAASSSMASSSRYPPATRVSSNGSRRASASTPPSDSLEPSATRLWTQHPDLAASPPAM
jgi:hypothetical protein